jgi:type II secretory pathway pseudopilin PulG
MLVAVIFMLALLIISLAVAAPKVARDIQRDRELETMQRGKQYIRAIRLYYRKFSAYPPSIDALVKTQNLRFLRKKYVDPTTGKEEWKPIHFGQNKAPTAMGFFGQPLTGSTLAGIGPNGGNGVAGAANAGSAFMGSNNSSGSNNSFGSNSSFGSSGASGMNSTFGANNANANPSAGGSGSTDSSGTNNGTGSGSSSDPNNLGGSGQTFGGLGIIGFSPGSPKASLLVYKTKSHYNEWEFVYDPIMERMMQAAGNLGGMGTPASNLNGSPTGNQTGGGLGPTGGNSGGGFGGGGGFGSGGSSSPTNTTP